MIIDGIPSSPTLLYLIERPHHFKLLNQWLILGDGGECGWVMLLVADNDVAHEGALAREERTRGLQSHRVPHLTVSFRVMAV